MASQTIQDVKAIYAAAKAKFDSLPEDNKIRVHVFFHQCIMAGCVALMMVFAFFGVQLYLYREEARQVQREASEMRWQYELRLRNATRSK